MTSTVAFYPRRNGSRWRGTHKESQPPAHSVIPRGLHEFQFQQPKVVQCKKKKKKKKGSKIWLQPRQSRSSSSRRVREASCGFEVDRWHKVQGYPEIDGSSHSTRRKDRGKSSRIIANRVSTFVDSFCNMFVVIAFFWAWPGEANYVWWQNILYHYQLTASRTGSIGYRYPNCPTPHGSTTR